MHQIDVLYREKNLRNDDCPCTAHMHQAVGGVEGGVGAANQFSRDSVQTHIGPTMATEYQPPTPASLVRGGFWEDFQGTLSEGYADISIPRLSDTTRM